MATGKKPLVVFLAAGASAALGAPLTDVPTDRILDAIRKELDRKENRQFFRTDPMAIDLLAAYLTSAYRGNKNWNFEHLLYCLEVLDSLKTTWNVTTHPNFKIMEGILTGPNGILLPCFQDYFASISKEAFYRELHKIFSEASGKIPHHPNWVDVQKFLVKLKDEFDLYIVTLNYDLVVEQALGWGPTEEGFKPIPGEKYFGFGAFTDAPRLMHLHGSVLFGCVLGLNGSSVLHVNDLVRFDTPQEAFDSLKVPETHKKDGHQIDVGPFITGFRKEERFICDPYFSFYHHFTNLLAEIPRVLVVGYGFNDDHINNLFKRIRNWHGPERRLVCVDFVEESKWDKWCTWVQDLHKRDFWEMAQRWAYEDNPFYNADYPDPYIPSGTEKDNARIYFKGFADAARNHSIEIVDYLKS